MGNNYSFNDYNKENMARAVGRSLPISPKQSIEICNFIRNKNVNYAKNVLSNVIKEKQIIPFRRFNSDVGHKKQFAAGRYPKKASKEILDLINVVEANAQFKGLNTSNLIITHINSNKAATVMRSGRKRSRKAKRTNVEIVVQEKAIEKKAEVKKEIKKVKSDDKSTKPQENTKEKHPTNKKEGKQTKK